MRRKLGDGTEVVPTICDRCHGTCGVLAYVKDGRVVKVEGDPDFPQNEGFMCPKGLAVTQVLYHPDRIKYPMKRLGERGEGKWQRISWDEALDTTAARFREIMEKWGPESITWSWGDHAFLPIKCSHTADGEAVSPVNIGHGHGGFDDTGQLGNIGHLI